MWCLIHIFCLNLTFLTHTLYTLQKKKKRTGLQLRFKNAAVAPKKYNLINYFSTKYSILSIFFFLQNIHMKPLNGRIYDKGQLFANKNIKWNLRFLVLLELQWNYLQMFIIKTHNVNNTNMQYSFLATFSCPKKLSLSGTFPYTNGPFGLRRERGSRVEYNRIGSKLVYF